MMNRRQMLTMVPAVAALPLAWAQSGPRRVDITAQRFRFTPNVIPVRAGETVVLRIKALDFAHGFYVPDLDVRADLVPGRVVELTLTPSKAGRLAFVCDNFCGDGHEDMGGHFDVMA